MDFKTDQPIYLQIVSYIGVQLLEGVWTEGERIPSVRELGATLQVNPNTVLRAFERLQSDAIILNKRGMGYYVAEGGLVRWKQMQRVSFFEELYQLFDRMEHLEVSKSQFLEHWANYYKKKSKSQP